ncbi:hypothetical protein [Haloarcula nitratireducens]|uniref:Cell surface glycoprotein related protein n=1 Tax=Haloarcula nitratireducens TaxID=2487749 RepID=A0AAW4PFJ4_9EURY|nr:hypothetical protein [Halomicroarcula nitratireducens]MBX0296260.1 hypothetical protein [Halomicroarcula nitratireducens]
MAPIPSLNRLSGRRLATLLVVAAVLLAPTTGLVAAQADETPTETPTDGPMETPPDDEAEPTATPSDEEAETPTDDGEATPSDDGEDATPTDEAASADGQYAAVQGDQCTVVTPLSGNESAQEFYDYRLPEEFADNPYINTTGDAYGSEGTTDLQRANTSIVFLYSDTNGTEDTADDTLSLVFVHGNEGNANSSGGSASLDITQLPANGTWTVRDDQYDGPTSYDVWTVDNETARVDWTWGDAATDGGVYSGLGENFSISVSPAFNDEAVLAGQYYNGTVENWEVVSANASDEDAEPTRTALDLSEPMTLSTGGCEGVAADENATDEGETGTETPMGGNETATDAGTPSDVIVLDEETATPENETATADN